MLNSVSKGCAVMPRLTQLKKLWRAINLNHPRSIEGGDGRIFRLDVSTHTQVLALNYFYKKI